MNIRRQAVAICAAMLLTGSMWAQHNHQSSSEPAKHVASTSSEDTVKACRHHMSKASDTLAQLEAAVDQAQKADTPAKKDAALERVRELTGELKHHISMCPMMQSGSRDEMGSMDCMKDQPEESSEKK